MFIWNTTTATLETDEWISWKRWRWKVILAFPLYHVSNTFHFYLQDEKQYKKHVMSVSVIFNLFKYKTSKVFMGIIY